MKIFEKKIRNCFLLSAFILFLFCSCLTPKKLDKFVAARYNNELPAPKQKRGVDITVTPTPADNSSISTTVHKTDKFLPLLVYWKYDHRLSCSLHPNIAAANFSNAINAAANRGLVEKLNGKKMELIVKQAPSAFSIVAKENMVWLIYGFSWAKIYMEPDFKDLVVAYKLMEADKTVKTGTVTVKNTDKNRNLGYFQSWKSATSEYLSAYNSNFTGMTRAFVAQLTQEL